MKRAAILSVFFLLSAGLLTDSCDSKVKGCTDPDSINYDELAEKDDGSCRYEGSAVFWYDETASSGLVADGAIALTFYLDDEVIGSTATSVFWASAPDCNENGSITVTRSLGKNKTKDFALSVVDQDGNEYWSTDIGIEANTCLAMKLTWSARKK